MARAEFEVRITPLMRGVPGGMEVDGSPTGVTVIEEADTTLVEQILDLEVNHELNEFRTGTVVLSIHDPVVADLEPFAQAVWIGYKRPLETVAEAILYGQCNVVTNYAEETVTLEIQDPSLRLQHHYVRRGDEALNIDKNRGRLESHAESFFPIVEAARNIDLQQDRNVPALGLYVETFYYTVPLEGASFIDFDRGQECWDLIQQIVRGVGGPDIDLVPRWHFPTDAAYAYLYAHNPADPPNPALGARARNLDPADPDDPEAGEVVFDFGIGQDNLEALEERPTRPTTHAHVLDEPAVYRETSADADSSAAVGVFVDWIAAGFAIKRPTNANPEADTSPLRAIADAHIEAYGVPPKFLTLTLRPDDALGFHYGHPDWFIPATSLTLGEWYIGDYVRVRGLRGERSVNELVRIVGVKFKYDLQRDLVVVSVSTIPAVGGTPGTDLEEVAQGGGSGAIAPGDDIATATPMGVAIAQGISPTGFEATPTRTSLCVAVASGISPTHNQEASFPSRLSTSGRDIVDENGVVLSRMAGGSIHVAPATQRTLVPTQDFLDDIASKGATFIRAICQWSAHENVQGVWNADARASLDTFIERCEIAGLYAMLELHLNVPGLLPSWPMTGADDTAKYDNHGAFITAAMANRYGNPASAQYSKAVVGFGLNEPPLDDSTIRNGNNAIPYLEGVQRTMITRFRVNGNAPDWIGFVCWGYANQTPYPASPRTPASTTAYDSVGGNVIIDVHDYGMGGRNGDTNPNEDGRQANGTIYPTYQDPVNGLIVWQTGSGGLTYTSSTVKQQQMAAHLADYETFCAAANVPLMMGEVNWDAGNTGKAAWWADKRAAMNTVNFAIVLTWIFAKSSLTQDPWSSTPGGAWDSQIETLLENTW